MTGQSSPQQKPAAPSAAPRIGFWRSVAFGSGGFLDNFGSNGVKNAAQPMYNLIFGINPAFIGVMIAVTRVWEAFTNPFMGSITDNARTRWGRRRPFIFLGAVTSALTFPLLWWIPSGLGGTGQLAWLLFVAFLFYTCYSLFTIPYHALGFEYSPDYHGKTKLMGYRTIFTSISGFGVQWFFPLTQFGWFGTPRQSLLWVSFALAVIICGTAVLPAIFCKTNDSAGTGAGTARPAPPKVTLLEALGATMKCRPFLIILGFTVLLIFGTNLVNSLGLYVNIYHVHAGDKPAASIISGWSGTVYHVTVILTMPLLIRLSRAIGKKTALNLCLGLVLVSCVGKWFLFTPAHPWWQLIVQGLMAPGGAGLWLLAESMVADVCQWEEARSGRRMEGMFGAVYAWIMKVGMAACVAISGFILVWVGFDVNLGGAQSPQTIYWMRMLFSWLPGIAAVAGIFLVSIFPLNAARMEEVRGQLEQRNQNP
jgi:GPH family glycoside/pentoside/hexuronide:cation symporter